MNFIQTFKIGNIEKTSNEDLKGIFKKRVCVRGLIELSARANSMITAVSSTAFLFRCFYGILVFIFIFMF